MENGNELELAILELNKLAFKNMRAEISLVIKEFPILNNVVLIESNIVTITGSAILDWSGKKLDVALDITQSEDLTTIASLVIKIDTTGWNTLEVTELYGLSQDLYLACGHIESAYNFYVTDLLFKAGIKGPAELLPESVGALNEVLDSI